MTPKPPLTAAELRQIQERRRKISRTPWQHHPLRGAIYSADGIPRFVCRDSTFDDDTFAMWAPDDIDALLQHIEHLHGLLVRAQPHIRMVGCQRADDPHLQAEIDALLTEHGLLKGEG